MLLGAVVGAELGVTRFEGETEIASPAVDELP
jgi:hypothetical protein